jgi:hypothetical protein
VKDPRLAEFDALFGDSDSWYTRALGCQYAKPADISLLWLFYNGFDDEPREVTDEEWEFLEDYTLEDTYLEVIRMPASKMNKVLTQYFGITLKDVKKSGFEYLLYLESTDCYYDMHNDAHGIMNFKATNVEEMSNGTIRVSYIYYNSGGTYVVTLKPKKDGYQILSNLKETDPSHPIYPDSKTALAKFDALFGDSDSWYNQALTCEFTSAWGLDLQQLFYRGFEGESQKPTEEERAALKNNSKIKLEEPLIRLPADKIKEVLMWYFGTRIQGLNRDALNDFVYLESTDCYYMTHRDTNGITGFKAKSVEKQSDGTVRVSYTCDNYDGTYVVTLRPNGGNGYLILSNQKAK